MFQFYKFIKSVTVIFFYKDMGQGCLGKSESMISAKKYSSQQFNLQNNDCQYRDKQILMELPDLSNQLKRQNQIQIWLTKIFNQVFSTAFYFYEQKKLTYNQTKLFASSNILKNLIRLEQSQVLQNSDLKLINQFSANNILPYLKGKYPMSSQSQVNKKLLKKIKQIDNLDDTQNDYMVSSNVNFEYRQNGNYNDLIMKFLNEIIEYPQKIVEKMQKAQKITSQNQSYFSQFKTIITELFESCYNYNKVYKNNGKKQLISSEEKDAYQAQVKSFTQYLIGRKLSNNTQIFSQEEIENKTINIKSAGILRILTKWADQLWSKFKNPMIFAQRAQPFRYLDKRPGFALPKKHKLALVQLIEEEKKKVTLQIQQIVQQIYKHQNLILKEAINRQASFIPELQFKEGYFVDNCVNALQSFIIKYINILIHGLMSVSKFFYQKNSKILSAPYQLLTFKIGDLIRCKCHSKQKQILFIYDQIMQYDSKILNVIRVKNRLSSGTQDILINVKFYNDMIAEIQLAIDSNKNQHIQNCSKFNHFIYELQRAQFGPLMQLSSVWSFYNERYQKIHQAVLNSKRIQTKNKKQERICKSNHNLEIQLNPFLCRECNTFFVRDECIIQNQKCSRCEYRICSLCRLKFLSDEELKKLIFKNDELRQNCKRFQGNNIKDLPQTGIVFDKTSKSKKLTCFKAFQDERKNKIMIKKKRDEDFKIFNVTQVNLSNYLIWENQISLTYFEGITYQNQIKKSCILPKTFKDIQKKHKINLYLQQNALTDGDFQRLINKNWKDSYKSSIKTANLAANEFISMKNILNHLPNIEFLVLDENQVSQINIPEFATNLKKLSLTKIKFQTKRQFTINSFSILSNLKYINLGWNKLEALPEQLGNLTGLQQLSVQQNKLTQLFSSIIKLKELKILALNGNLIEKLQNQIYELPNLEQLQVKSNKLLVISQKIKKLKALKKLRVDQNKLLQLPQGLGELSQLIQISAAKNQIKKVQKSIFQLKKLQFLILNNNQIEQIPDIQGLQSLEKLLLGSNQIKQTFSISKLQKLKILELQENKIKQINDQIYFSLTLQELNLSKNQIQVLKPNIKHLKSLKKLDLRQNKLNNLPSQISAINSLQELKIEGNQILILPDTFTHFLKLVKLSIKTSTLYNQSLKILQKLQAKGVKIQRK